MTEKRSMVFIDGANLSNGWKRYHLNHKLAAKSVESMVSRRIDYPSLIKHITAGTDFIRGYYYDATEYPIDKKKQAFFDMLRRNEITIVTKPLRYRTVTCKHCSKKDVNIPYQKGVDVSLVTDAMALAFEKAYEIGILVTGDNDFVDAVNYIKGKGIKVWVVSFASHLGEDLMRSADKVIRIDAFTEEITRSRKF